MKESFVRIQFGIFAAAALTFFPCTGCCAAPSDATTQTIRLKKEFGEAADALKSWTAEQKNEYVKKLRVQYAEMRPRIEKLKRHSQMMGIRARHEMQPYIDDLEKKRIQLGKQMDQFSTSSKAAWNDVKDGLDSAWSDVTKAYEKARSKY
jgi:hypothetical protein